MDKYGEHWTVIENMQLYRTMNIHGEQRTAIENNGHSWRTMDSCVEQWSIIDNNVVIQSYSCGEQCSHGKQWTVTASNKTMDCRGGQLSHDDDDDYDDDNDDDKQTKDITHSAMASSVQSSQRRLL